MFMADAHIKTRTWINSPQIQGDAYAALSKVAAIENLPRTLVIGGDWFDSMRPSSEDMFRTSLFAKCFDRVLYIRGNHDKSVPNWLASLPNAEQLTTTPVPIGDAHIAGLDWVPDEEELQLQLSAACSEAMELPTCTILYIVMHQPSRHLLGFDGAWKVDFAKVAEDFEQIAKSMHIVFLIGDIHVQDTRKFGDITVHSPGCLYPLTEDTVNDPHGVSIVENLDIAHHTIKVRNYIEAHYTNDTELEALIKEAEAASTIEKLLPTRISVVIPEGVRVSTSKAVVLQAVTAESDPSTTQGASEKPSTECTMRDALIQACGDDKKLSSLALALYDSEDQAASIESWLKFWKVERG
jgi:hypothetical protein